MSLGYLFTFTVLVFSNLCFAETLKFDFRLSMNGKELSSPTLLADIGKETSIMLNSNDQNTLIKVFATTPSPEIIEDADYLINLKILSIQDGKKHTLSEPRFQAKLNEEVSLKQYDVDGQETLSISLKATRP